MKNKVLFCALMAVVAFVPQSCMIRFGSSFGSLESHVIGSGNMTELRFDELKDFDEISLSLPMDIEYAYGEPSVVISCDDNAAKYIDVKILNGKLELEMSPEKATLVRCNIKATVRSRSLKTMSIAGTGSFAASGLEEDRFSVNIAGSGEIDIDGLKANSVKMSIAGSGDVDMDAVDAHSVTGSIAGSGDISVSGRADRATFNVTGSGDIDTDDLDCPKIEVRK